MHGDTGSPKDHHHQGKSSESLLDRGVILKGLDILPGMTMLDAGCGNGHMSKEFSELVKPDGQVYALDPDENAIKILKEETRGNNIIPIVGDITQKTEIPGLSIDLMYVSTVLHGFSRIQMDDFCKEAKRLLKPKGMLAIIEIKKEPTPFGPPLDIRFSPQELREIIDLAPKQTLEIGPFFYMQTFKK
jgi:ubiquinone/menaquinone biosynthesis C-methylase UbiE